MPENNDPTLPALKPDVSPASSTAAVPSNAAQEFVGYTAERARELKESTLDSIHHVRDAAVDATAALREAARKSAGELKTAASHLAEDARSIASREWQEGREKAKQFFITTEDYIRANPTQSVLGAVGIGFLLGLLSRR